MDLAFLVVPETLFLLSTGMEGLLSTCCMAGVEFILLLLTPPLLFLTTPLLLPALLLLPF
jgi:hypothetical protein